MFKCVSMCINESHKFKTNKGTSTVRMNDLDDQTAQHKEPRVGVTQEANTGPIYSTPQKMKTNASGSTPQPASTKGIDTTRGKFPPLDDDYDHTEAFNITRERAQHKTNQGLLNVYNTFEDVEDSYSHLKNANCSSRKVQNSDNIYSHATDAGRRSEDVEDPYNHLNESPWPTTNQQPDNIYNNTKSDSKIN